MRKVIFSVLFSILSLAALAQGRQIEIRSSELVKGFQAAGFARIIRPVFVHEGSTLASDSADFNQAANTFEAFGHVVITQPSGTVIYSDHLNYDGNTKLAVLTNKVRLIDGDATLTTDHLTYNMTTKIGTYNGGGKIVNGKNVLTSKNGYYFETSRDAYFRYDVVLTSPDALIKTDTLKYNSTSKIAYFYGPTNIYGKDDTLYTENGNYNTQSDQARFGKKNLYTQGSKSLTGDSLFYDRKAGFGRAIGNVFFVDTAEKAQLRGGIGLYKKADESILVTINPYVVIISESDSAKVDSIWMTADTLFSKVIFTRDLIPYKKEEMVPDDQLATKEAPAALPQEGPADPENMRAVIVADISTDSADSLKTPGKIKEPEKLIPPPEKENPVIKPEQKPPAKSIPVKDVKKIDPQTEKGKSDTLKKVVLLSDSVSTDTAKSRIVIAYHRAKIFKSDLQARADSMFFSYADSTVRCFVNPMIWAQGSQLSGDTVFLQMKNKKMDNMLLQHNSFIVNTEDADSTNFNQIKGKIITGYFRDNKLNSMFVDGNAESVYYVKEDSSYTGLNHLVSGRLKILLKDSKLQSITAIHSVDASITPMADLKEEEKVLKGFIWKPRDRPKSKEEIIPQLAKEEKKAEPVKKAPVKAETKAPVKTSAKDESVKSQPKANPEKPPLKQQN
ncbi:MAG: OstA-like protein [Daejeonella sp.]|uniref:OstA-like protein n=1 Tax=Daejeonella sp. TaxID=2805397 RepID=UPI002736A0FA|nr:OstA-like protein [Daejeonella sp.]MDP3467273.1 OstA-like protein [Daejeonella sp.]